MYHSLHRVLPHVSVGQERKGGAAVAPLCPPAAVSFPQVLLAATHITAVGWQCAGCSDCGTRHNVRQGWDPCAKAVPSSVWWDLALWWDVLGGWPLSPAGSWQGAAPRVAHSLDPPLPWSLGGMLSGATSPGHRAPRACQHRLWPHMLSVAAPCLSPISAHFCPGSKQPSNGSILSLSCLGLEPVGVKRREDPALSANSAENTQPRFRAHLTFGLFLSLLLSLATAHRLSSQLCSPSWHFWVLLPASSFPGWV